MRFTIKGADGETGQEVWLTVDAASAECARTYASRKGIIVCEVAPAAEPCDELARRAARVIDYATPSPRPDAVHRGASYRYGALGQTGRVMAFVGLGAVIVATFLDTSLNGSLMVVGIIVMAVGALFATFDRSDNSLSS